MDINIHAHDNLTLRVLSYNIRHGTGTDNRYDIRRTARVIRETGADLAGLQEVDLRFGERSGHDDTIRLLADETAMQYAYGANLVLPPEPGRNEVRQYGNAVLSKYPIRRQINHLLSSFGDEQRGMLETELAVGGLPVHFFSVHLGLDPAQRKVQVEEIITIAGAKRGPLLIVGDFNASPDSPEIKAMKAVFRSVYGGVSGGPPTFPAGAALETIDYIFMGGEVEICGEPAVLPVLASDHYPIVTEVCIRRNNGPFMDGTLSIK